MSEYLTFANIYDTVCKAIGDNGETGAQARLLEVKSVINMVYQEVMNCDDLFPLFWMMDFIDDVKTKSNTTITGITAANPAIVTSTSHGYVTGDIIQLTGILGMIELNDRICVVVRNDDDSYLLANLAGDAIDASAYTAYSSGGTAKHRGVTLSKKLNSIMSFAWLGYSGQVKPISIPGTEELTSWLDVTNTSKPQRYLHKQYYVAKWTESDLGEYATPEDDYRADRLLWFSLPDQNYTARIWGNLRAVNLDGATDVPRLPAEFHHSLIAGSLARMITYGTVQIENAVIWPGLYKMHLEAIKAYNRKWWKQFKEDERSKPYLL